MSIIIRGINTKILKRTLPVYFWGRENPNKENDGKEFVMYDCHVFNIGEELDSTNEEEVVVAITNTNYMRVEAGFFMPHRIRAFAPYPKEGNILFKGHIPYGATYTYGEKKMIAVKKMVVDGIEEDLREFDDIQKYQFARNTDVHMLTFFTKMPFKRVKIIDTDD